MEVATKNFQSFAMCCLIAAQVTAGVAAAEDVSRLPPAECEAFLAALEDELQAVESLEVRFRQERQLALLAEPAVSEGVLAFVRPDRLHWEWTAPYPSVLVLNHGRVERFEVVDGVPRPLRSGGAEMLRSVAVQMTQWLQGRFRSSSELFRVEVLRGPPATIVLIPLADTLEEILSRVEVELGDDPRVARVVLTSARGETTVMRYFDERRNVALPPALFDLAAPLLLGEPPTSP